MSIHQLNFDGKDKVEIAIDRLKTFEPEEGYWLAFSGGKDSVVVKALADMAGVKYDAHFNVTSVDPPELIYFIRESYPDVDFFIPKDRDGNRISMWSLIPQKRMPPTRIARYCCEALKEVHGIGRLTVTGVRWAESANRRKNQGGISVFGKPKALKGSDAKYSERHGGMLSFDNVENRKIVNMCYKTHKTLINPIIDWTDGEVWEFIREYDVPYCKLYDDGFKRVGCIGCPLSNMQVYELERYPKYKALYLKAFEKMLEANDARGIPRGKFGDTAEDVYEWWIGNSPKEISEDLITLDDV